MVSTPISLISASAGSVPTHENHAGEVSKRRAVSGSRSGGPNWSVSGSLAANHPAWCGVIVPARRSLRTRNAVPRGHISHL
jgi:hypothetical protein